MDMKAKLYTEPKYKPKKKKRKDTKIYFRCSMMGLIYLYKEK